MTNPFESNFLKLNKTWATDTATQFGTPLFIMDEKGILNRFSSLQNAVKRRYAHSIIAVSYKTNFIKGLLALLHGCGAHAEVVSGVEYTVAKKIRLPQQKIIFNGPMKTEKELMEAIHDNTIINCDHQDEIDRIEQCAKMLGKKLPIGIRIYFKDNNDAWNRFGFCVSKDLSDQGTIDLIKRISTSSYLKLTGLHTHIGTNIRDLTHFTKLAQYLNHFAFHLRNHFQIELDWIDVGGGLAGISPYLKENRTEPHPLPDCDAYAEAIINPLLPYLHSLAKPATLIFEPGRTLFEAYGALLTRVIGRRIPAAEKTSAIICDAGINTLATSHVYDFPIHVFDRNIHKQTAPRSILLDSVMTTLYGPTCNQQDHLHSPLLLPHLKPGDLLLFYGVGSYCMAFSYTFIRFKPGVILWRDDNHCEWLRKQETLEHNALLEYMPSLDMHMRSAAC